jgi:hypothetical protein
MNGELRATRQNEKHIACQMLFCTVPVKMEK